jgi:hypothetical protein
VGLSFTSGEVSVNPRTLDTQSPRPSKALSCSFIYLAYERDTPYLRRSSVRERYLVVDRPYITITLDIDLRNVMVFHLTHGINTIGR